MLKKILLLLVFIGISSHAYAAKFDLKPGQEIIGKIQTIETQAGETFASIAQKYDVAYYGLVEANPGVNPDQPLKRGTMLIIPSQYILPQVPHRGIVINQAELRLYYFPKDKAEVFTFPIGIGRVGWQTPEGVLKIIQKIKHPNWYPPKSIREADLADGIKLPQVVPAGPNNPLGDYAMRLSDQTYLIHGTNDPSGVGRRSSAGCVRMYPENIEQLFNMVPMHTQVRIINQALKLAWQGKNLYLESHVPLQENESKYPADGAAVVPLIDKAIQGMQSVDVNWQLAIAVSKEQQGIPQIIATRAHAPDYIVVNSDVKQKIKNSIHPPHHQHQAGKAAPKKSV